MILLCVLTLYFDCTISSLPVLSKTLVFYGKLAKTDKNLGMKVAKNPCIKFNLEAITELSMPQNPITSLCVIIYD